jgi:hypothetical protein
MADIQMVVGDTAPVIQAQLFQADGVTVLADITGASIVFRVRKPGGLLVLAEGSVLDGATAKVDVALSPVDLPLAGLYRGRWKVTMPDGTVLSVPSSINTVSIQVNREV